MAASGGATTAWSWGWRLGEAGRLAVVGACLALLATALAVALRAHPPVSGYGLTVGSWLLLQTVLAQAEHRRQARWPHVRHDATVTVVVPSYRESPALLRACVRSLLSQDYDGRLEVIVVDDGSPGEPVTFDELAGLTGPQRQLVTHRLPHNVGKRQAQAWGFRRAGGEFVVTVDSDTELAPDAVDRALALLDDPRVGAATGVALVRNGEAWLPRLINLRYWAAFCQERAAQSRLGVVNCCSGVFSVYRRELLDELLERYLGQRFLGRACTYGDDRHLTNLVLWQGWQVRLAGDAYAWTDAPTRLRHWVKQQERWSKSFYREFLWSLRFAHQRNWYFAYCLVFQLVLPVMFLYGLGRGVWHAGHGHLALAAHYAAMVVLMAWLRGLYGLLRTGQLDFLLMPVYGFLHVLLIFPVRLLAFFTLWDTRWGTR